MTASSLDIRRASLADLPELATLFNAYRDFYACPADAAATADFLRDRLLQGQCWAWLAWLDGQAVGFVNVYPSFCSLVLAPIAILHDLYTTPAARRHGVAAALMQAVEHEARQRHVARIDLTTAHTNHTAQALYAAQGYVHDQVFRAYTKTLPPPLPGGVTATAAPTGAAASMAAAEPAAPGAGAGADTGRTDADAGTGGTAPEADA